MSIIITVDLIKFFGSNYWSTCLLSTRRVSRLNWNLQWRNPLQQLFPKLSNLSRKTGTQQYAWMTQKTTLGLINCRNMQQSNPAPTRTSAYESTRQQILDICPNQLELDHHMDSYISTAHRILSNDKDKHRPILVRFTYRRPETWTLQQKMRFVGHHHSQRLHRQQQQLTKNNARIQLTFMKIWTNS